MVHEAYGENRFGEVELPKLRGTVHKSLFDREKERNMEFTMFLKLCNWLVLTTCIDLFASMHHQLPRYHRYREAC